jgi:nucleoside-diphosphate-sugar epimerase
VTAVPDGQERFLVTGGTGCIGSWVVHELVREGAGVTVLSASGADRRLRLILSDDEVARVALVRGDVADLATFERVALAHHVDRIIHLAGLQLPFCAADPSRGAQVNVVGTVNAFEVARRIGIDRVVYASSAAVYGPRTAYAEAVLPPDAPFLPTSHYGVYKVANEQSARVYWQNEGISSVGLRPHSAYGPGREQGVTSKPTVAMIAAAAGRPYRIPFGGRAQFQHAQDVARVFIAAARAPLAGSHAFSIGGRITPVADIVAGIEEVVPGSRGAITFADEVLGFPEAFDDAPLRASIGDWREMPLAAGIASTIDCYRDALRRGIIGDADLDRMLA